MTYRIYKNKKEKWVVRHKDGGKPISESDTMEEAIAKSATLAKKCRAKVEVNVRK